MLSTAMAGRAPLPAPRLANGATATEGRGILVAHYRGLLAAKDAEIARLRARVAALEVRHHPEDHGLPPVRLTPTEEALLLCLLPAGRPVHRDELAARVWPEMVAAGLHGPCARLVRVTMSRVRGALEDSGWTIPGASLRSEYVLCGPGDPLPAGYASNVRAANLPHVRPEPRYVPCPECDGAKWRGSARCRLCADRRRMSATRRDPTRRVCPRCGGGKSYRAALCRQCEWARRMKRDGGV